MATITAHSTEHDCIENTAVWCYWLSEWRHIQFAPTTHNGIWQTSRTAAQLDGKYAKKDQRFI